MSTTDCINLATWVVHPTCEHCGESPCRCGEILADVIASEPQETDSAWRKSVRQMKPNSMQELDRFRD